MTTHRPWAVALLYSCMIASSTAYPSLWVEEAIPDDNVPDPCHAHPQEPDGAHLAAVRDPTTVYVVTDSTGKAVNGVCPGAPYTVKIGFPEKRYLLATASAGTLKGTNLAQTLPTNLSALCSNRFVYGMPKLMAAINFTALTLVLPCTTTKGVSVNVTSAPKPTSAFLRSSLALPLLSMDECMAVPSPCLANHTHTDAANETHTDAPAASPAPAPKSSAGRPITVMGALAVAVAAAAVVLA